MSNGEAYSTIKQTENIKELFDNGLSRYSEIYWARHFWTIIHFVFFFNLNFANDAQRLFTRHNGSKQLHSFREFRENRSN